MYYVSSICNNNNKTREGGMHSVHWLGSRGGAGIAGKRKLSYCFYNKKSVVKKYLLLLDSSCFALLVY